MELTRACHEADPEFRGTIDVATLRHIVMGMNVYLDDNAHLALEEVLERLGDGHGG